MCPCCLARDCPSGETCANTLHSREPVCAWKVAVRLFPNVRPVKPKPKGLSFDGCRRDNECAGARSCQLVFPGFPSFFPPCESALAVAASACLPKDIDTKGFKCLTSANCRGGEVYARTPFINVTTCTSKNAEKSYDFFSEVPKPGLCPVRIVQDPPQHAGKGGVPFFSHTILGAERIPSLSKKL